jgi:hypothetical protein
MNASGATVPGGLAAAAAVVETPLLGRLALSTAVHVLCTLSIGSLVFWFVVAPRFQQGMDDGLPRLLVPVIMADPHATDVARMAAPELIKSRAWYAMDGGSFPPTRVANGNLVVLCVAAAVVGAVAVLLAWAHSGLSFGQGMAEVATAVSVYLIVIVVEIAFILFVAVQYTPVAPSTFAKAVLRRVSTRCFGQQAR